MEWKIYYSDETTYSSDEGDWESSVKRIYTVASLDTTGVWGRTLTWGFEFYYRVAGFEVMGSNDRAAILLHVPDILDNQIKLGGNAFREVGLRIMTFAGHDPDFPIRTSPRRRASDFPIDDPRNPSLTP